MRRGGHRVEFTAKLHNGVTEVGKLLCGLRTDRRGQRAAAAGVADVRGDGLKTVPNNINDARSKPKRLTERGILVEIERGLFTQPWP